MPPRRGLPRVRLRSGERLRRALDEKRAPIPPRVHFRTRSSRGAARRSRVPGWSRSSVSSASSSLPCGVAPLLLIRHVPRSDRIASPARELDHDTKERTTGVGLAEHVVHRIRSRSLCPQHKRCSETYLLEFLWPHAMLGKVVDPLLGPKNFGDRHVSFYRQPADRCPAAGAAVRRTLALSRAQGRRLKRRVRRRRSII